ncbi:MAG: DUF262 domain-containing HNH endonuclease family protein [Neomegalonema sp.]|nr:DUF262 domain-containing HNH endonuclease family protein [Neomegalonema sp.]
MNFETRVVEISQLLGGQNAFIMPPFQRAYAWDAEMAARLCEDLQDAAIRYSRGVEADFGGRDPYFLGTLVLSRNVNSAPYSVVDGQQRLTTLTAVLAVLRDRIADEGLRRSLQEFIVRPAQMAIGIAECARVTLRSIDHDNYARWIATMGGTRDLPAHADTDTSILLLNALKAINKSIETAQDSYYQQMAEFILNRCVTVVIESYSIEAAFRLFQTVNRPGQPIDTLYLARSEYIGVTADQGPEGAALAAAWDAVEDQLSQSEFESYIGVVAERTVPEKRGRPLLEIIRTISHSPILTHQFRTSLNRFLVSYEALESSNLPFGADTELVNATLRSALGWNNSNWKNVALDWLIKEPPARETVTFFKAIDALCMYFSIMGVSARTQRKRFEAIAAQMESRELFASTKSPLFLSDQEIAQTLAKLREPIRAASKYLRPLLARLNSQVGAPPFDPEALAALTVEHVLPQKPGRNSSWLKQFPDAADRKKLTYLLGNHALLTRTANPRGGNKEFEEKRRIYFSFEGYQSFPITSHIQSYEVWSDAAIHDRTEQLLNIARDALKAL